MGARFYETTNLKFEKKNNLKAHVTVVSLAPAGFRWTFWSAKKLNLCHQTYFMCPKYAKKAFMAIESTPDPAKVAYSPP